MSDNDDVIQLLKGWSDKKVKLPSIFDVAVSFPREHRVPNLKWDDVEWTSPRSEWRGGSTGYESVNTIQQGQFAVGDNGRLWATHGGRLAVRFPNGQWFDVGNKEDAAGWEHWMSTDPVAKTLPLYQERDAKALQSGNSNPYMVGASAATTRTLDDGTVVNTLWGREQRYPSQAELKRILHDARVSVPDDEIEAAYKSYLKQPLTLDWLDQPKQETTIRVGQATIDLRKDGTAKKVKAPNHMRLPPTQDARQALKVAPYSTPSKSDRRKANAHPLSKQSSKESRGVLGVVLKGAKRVTHPLASRKRR